MDESKAFEVLGLARSASKDEIEAKYRDLVRERHPDHGGDEEAMRNLNVAREVAVTAAQNRALVPVETVRDVVAIAVESVMRRSEEKAASERIAETVLREHSGPLQYYKAMAAKVGYASAGLVLLTSNVIPSLEKLFHVPWGVAAVFGVLVALCTFWHFRLSRVVDSLERDVNDLSERWSDRPAAFNLLNDILRFVYPEPRFTADGLERELGRMLYGNDYFNDCFPGRIRPWHRLMAYLGLRRPGPRLRYERVMGGRIDPRLAARVHRIGVSDAVRLLLAKAVENGVLVRDEELVDGGLVSTYHIEPSLKARIT